MKNFISEFESSIESEWSLDDFKLGNVASEYRSCVTSIKRMDNTPHVRQQPILGHSDTE